jgi:lipopolysaccharide/colanic/teichoic acid biosynthesis glycosyltransferase
MMASSIRQMTSSMASPTEGDSEQTEVWSDVLKRYAVDEVVAVTAWDELAIWSELAEACSDRGVIFRQLVTIPKPKIGKYHIEDAGNGQYFVSLETVSQDFLALAVKRALDIGGSILGLIICVLMYPLCAVWLRIVSPGAILFRQERMGRNGRFFTLYKFRTMRPNAELELPGLMALNQMEGALFKIKNDPRIIAGGNFMRRTHLDELPQFWNVLVGDMSLVGTRPPTRAEVESYESRHHRRLSMRPGITGVWQVLGNHRVRDFEEVVELDCNYIDNWSLGLDTKLIGQTILRVFRGSGW